MAIATTSTFNPNRARIVQLALTNVGAIGPGTVFPAQDAAPLVNHANDVLDILIKSMDSDGTLQWRLQERTQAITPNVSAYTLASDTYDIEGPGRYAQAGSTAYSTVYPMSHTDWMSLTDRTVQGPPTQYYLQKGMDASGLENNVLNFPTVPSTADSFVYMAVIKAKDAGNDANTLDVPQNWVRCLVLGLSADLAPGYGADMNRIQYFQTQFENERQRCLEQDQEHADVQIAPFGAYYYGSNGRMGSF